MIDIQVKVHDKFSIEFKLGFYVQEEADAKDSDFMVNMWLFLPNSLGINPMTYDKSQFYRDIKSNIRLITPIFPLSEITLGEAFPLRFLESSVRTLASERSRAAVSEYEYQIKMFMSIFKSALRDDVIPMLKSKGTDLDEKCLEYMVNVTDISHRYRDLKEILKEARIPQELLNFFRFGDEYMSNMIEVRTFRILRHLNRLRDGDHRQAKEAMAGLIRGEADYKKSQGFVTVEEKNPQRNRYIIFRRGILKKYIGSDLFLQARKKRDGILVEQVYLSLAAGISMFFATIVAFSFQQKYGNFTMPLFVALVVSYMLKDRIKELMRYYFAHRLGPKYFDNKTVIGIKDERLGWEKEGMDIITEGKVPAQVMEMRSRTPLVEAENRISDEKIILYRKRIRIDQEVLRRNNEYAVAGIHDIVRLHITQFIQKMDNPELPLYILKDDGSYKMIMGEKIYYLNFVVQLQHLNQLEYRRYRLVCTRQGIIEIETFE